MTRAEWMQEKRRSDIAYYLRELQQQKETRRLRRVLKKAPRALIRTMKPQTIKCYSCPRRTRSISTLRKVKRLFTTENGYEEREVLWCGRC